MANDLTELNERIELARGDIADLAKDEQAFFRDHTSIRIALNGATFEIMARTDLAVPTALKAKAGTIANELRSCLDGLACTLALRNGKTVPGVYFPISKSEEIFNYDGMQKIKKLAAADKAKIIALKPYRGGNSALFGLHEADRTRKHQRLVATTMHSQSLNLGGLIMLGAGVQMENCTIVQTGPSGTVTTPIEQFIYDASELVPGAEVRIAHGRGAPPPITPNFGVVYDEPAELKGQAVTQTLTNFAEAVRKIICDFE